MPTVSPPELAHIKRVLRRTQLAIARELLDHTDASGLVARTSRELERSTGYGSGAVLRAVRELMDAGFLERVGPSSSSVYRWDAAALERAAQLELAAVAPALAPVVQLRQVTSPSRERFFSQGATAQPAAAGAARFSSEEQEALSYLWAEWKEQVPRALGRAPVDLPARPLWGLGSVDTARHFAAVVIRTATSRGAPLEDVARHVIGFYVRAEREAKSDAWQRQDLPLRWASRWLDSAAQSFGARQRRPAPTSSSPPPSASPMDGRDVARAAGTLAAALAGGMR